jgi:hypothetical protein
MRISGVLPTRPERGFDPSESCQTPPVLSGGEVIIVAMALVALAALGVSALLGVFARLTRGRVDEPAPRGRFGVRRRPRRRR